MKILVLGTGCCKCNDAEKLVREVVGDRDIEVEKVTDLAEIMKYGVLSTPALVVDGVVKLVGTPTAALIEEVIACSSSE